MVTMPKTQIEEQHDAMPGVSMQEYCGHIALNNRVPFPEQDHYEGEVNAELHRGLWIARCPEASCSSAWAVSSVDPKFFCGECGAGWFTVIFPPNKAAIQRDVMKRPVPRRGLIHANWLPGETMAQLRAETLAERNLS